MVGVASGVRAVSRVSGVLTAAGGGIKAVGNGAKAAAQRPGAAWADARRRPKRAMTVLGVTAVVLALVAGLFGFFALRQAQIETARGAASAAAEQKVTALLSYDYRTIANDQADRAAMVTGQFRDDYGSLISDVVGPAAAQQQLTTRSSVVSSSVVGTDGTDQVTLLMFLNQTTQSADKPDPTLSGSRIRVTLQEVDGDWLVSELTPV
jgi:Mce-associated membrane protein